MTNKKEKRIIRHRKIRKKVFGTQNRPRLSIFRSNKNIYAQIIDDSQASTLVSISTFKINEAKKDESQVSKKINQAEKAGEAMAQLANKKNIKKVVFDRGGFKYHGRIKAFAQAAKKGGLTF